MKSVIYIIAEVFQLIIMMTFANKMLKKRYDNIRTFLIWVAFFVIDEILIKFQQINLVNTLLYFSGIIIVMCVSYRNTLKDKAITVMFITAFSFVSEFAAVIIFHTIFTGMDQKVEMVFAPTVAKFILFILLLIVMIKNNTIYVELNMKLLIATMIIPLCSTIIITLKTYDKGYSDINIYDVILVCVTMMVDYTAFYLFDNIQRAMYLKNKNELLEQQGKCYLNQCEELYKMWEDLRDFRHNIRNQYVVEETLLNEKKYDQLQLEYKEKLKSFRQDNIYSKTGNIPVDAIINYKASVIARMGGQISCDLKIPSDLIIDSDTLTLILGNLLDNVIDAFMNKKLNEKKCSIDINFDDPNLLIVVTNTFEGKRKKDMSNNYITTKEDSKDHGVGIKSVFRVVQKHNGKVMISEKEGKFIVKVHMFI